MALGLALATGACSISPTRSLPGAPVVWESWRLTGRIAVRQNDEAWHGGLLWAARDGVTTFRVSGPLGRPRLHLRYGPEGALLRLEDGQVHQAADPGTLLRETTGLDLPFEGLRFWVQGFADPSSQAVRVTDGDGNLRELRQAGWDIRYGDYAPYHGQMRPTRIDMSRGRLSVRLVLRSWEPEPEPAGSGR